MAEITVAEFINRTTPGHICPFCGTTQWSMLGERGLLRPNESGEFTLPAEIEKAFVTECNGCGFVRLIRPYNLIQKVAEAAAKQEAEAGAAGQGSEEKTQE